MGTVTLSPTGVDIAGITTAATLRATTGIVTSLTAGSLTSLGAISGTTGTFTGDVDIADKIIHTGDTNTAIRFPSADTITFETAGSEALRIDSSSRTLIATTDVGRSGANELTIGSASGDNGLTIRSGDDSEGNIYFSDGSSGGNEESRGIVRFDHADDSFKFFTANGNNFSTERLRLTNTGRLGINTNPDTTFHVYSSIVNHVAKIESGDTDVHLGLFDNTTTGVYLSCLLYTSPSPRD